MSLGAVGGKLMGGLRTFTPNFARFEIRTDGGEWRPTAGSFEWNAGAGANRLEARTVNAFGVTGAISAAWVAVEEKAGAPQRLK